MLPDPQPAGDHHSDPSPLAELLAQVLLPQGEALWNATRISEAAEQCRASGLPPVDTLQLLLHSGFTDPNCAAVTVASTYRLDRPTFEHALKACGYPSAQRQHLLQLPPTQPGN